MASVTRGNGSWISCCALVLLAVHGASAARGQTQPAPPPPQWKVEADARIEQYRKGDVRVEVVDANGRPVAGANVDVTLKRHAYGFGTAVNSEFLPVAGDANVALYRQAVARYFNKATIENGMKWKQWETPVEQRRTVQTTDWLRANGLALRGHTLLWQHANPDYSLPGDVLSRAMAPTFTAADARYVRGRVAGHVADIVGRYAGRAGEWDVVNEQYANHILTDKLNPGTSKERAPELATWFVQARAADADAKLYINDYGILSGQDALHRASYLTTVQTLKNSGAPIDGIGFQSHFAGGGERPSPKELYARLTQFAQTGLKLEATEFDMYGSGWGATKAENEQAKADFLRQFYTIFFSQPDTTGIVMWGFWDGKHWMDDAPMFRQDWTLKPAGGAYLDLVFKQWWTDESLATGADGVASVRGFLGDYDITVRDAAGATYDVPLTLGRGGATARVVLPGTGGAGVPEPAAGAMLPLVGLALRRRRPPTSPARS